MCFSYPLHIGLDSQTRFCRQFDVSVFYGKRFFRKTLDTFLPNPVCIDRVQISRHRRRRMCDHRERNIEMIVRMRTPCHTERVAQLSDPYRPAHRPKMAIRKRYVYRLKLYRMTKLSPVRRNHIRCSRHTCCTAEFGKDFSSRITMFRTARIFTVRQNTVHIFT